MFWCEIFLSKSAARFSLTSYRFFFHCLLMLSTIPKYSLTFLWTINVVFWFFFYVVLGKIFKNHMRIFSRLDVNQCIAYYCWSTLGSINWILYAEWLFRLQRFSVVILGVQRRTVLSLTIHRCHRPLFIHLISIKMKEKSTGQDQ